MQHVRKHLDHSGGDCGGAKKAQVTIKTGTDAQSKDLRECDDAVALGSYDAFSYLCGCLKDFFYHAYYPTEVLVTDKPYLPFLRTAT